MAQTLCPCTWAQVLVPSCLGASTCALTLKHKYSCLGATWWNFHYIIFGAPEHTDMATCAQATWWNFHYLIFGLKFPFADLGETGGSITNRLVLHGVGYPPPLLPLPWEILDLPLVPTTCLCLNTRGNFCIPTACECNCIR